MCSLSRTAVKSEAVAFHEALYVSLCFDVLRRNVLSNTSEDASCTLESDVGEQFTHLYVCLVVPLSFKATLGLEGYTGS